MSLFLVFMVKPLLVCRIDTVEFTLAYENP